ncbi:MAG: sensor histidine kinase [Proteobacteria bacterium]|nr:MAG: sensor histidine kinase [Pseudomonadota bacterium]
MQVNLSSHVGELVENLSKSVTAEPTRVTLRRTSPSVFMRSDRAQLCEKIVAELVSNSLKHGVSSSQNGEVSINIESLYGSEIMIEVTDNGVGLPQDFSLDAPTNHGLKMVKDLVKKLGGKIRVKNEQGTSFIINLSEPETSH